MKKRAARDQAYYVVTDAGGASRKSLASKTMILSGIVLLLFVIFHVKMFKFAHPMPMVAMENGHEMKDLYTVVVKAFADPLIVFCYTAAMVLLGSHLSHGIWSAFQSLGLNHPRYMPAIYAGGITLGFLIALGFVLIPLILFTFNEHFLAAGGI
jgi:succinate dehydrogenase / fumarate reductase cytochrome b subunit